jgi:opacity protein-like surface antigen
MPRLRAALSAALFLLVTSSTDVHAEWIVLPYAGITAGTHATFSDLALQFDNDFELAPIFGASFTWKKSELFEVEAEFGLSPDLFGHRVGDDDFQYGDNQFISVMGNLKVNLPLRLGSLQPYGVAGMGLFHTSISDTGAIFTAVADQPGYDVGGGVSAPIGGRFRLQADARYFRTLRGNEPKDELDLAIASLSFWRTTVGVGYRF